MTLLVVIIGRWKIMLTKKMSRKIYVENWGQDGSLVLVSKLRFLKFWRHSFPQDN